MEIEPIPFKLFLFNIKYMWWCSRSVQVKAKLKVFDSNFFALTRI